MHCNTIQNHAIPYGNKIYHMIQWDARQYLVSYPSGWSLLFIFGFMWWSSSWQWLPHIAGGKMFTSLLRAGLTVLVQFFCKMYFLWVSWGCKKNLVQFFLDLLPQMAVFFPERVPGWPDCQIWGLALNPGKVQCEEITFVFGGRIRMTTLLELRAVPSFLANCRTWKFSADGHHF